MLVSMDQKALKILVVEDEPTLNELIGHALKVVPEFEIHLAMSGSQALDVLENTVPDIILLDLIMPEMDGFEVLELVRSKPRFDRTACIIFTNLSQEVDRGRAKELGADNYFIKSDVDISRLREIVREEVAKRRALVDSQDAAE